MRRWVCEEFKCPAKALVVVNCYIEMADENIFA